MVIITKSCPKQSTCLCTTCWSVLAGGLIVDWLGSAFLNGDWWIIQIPQSGAPLSSSKIWRCSYISVKSSFGPRVKPSVGLLAVEIQSQILDSPFTQNVLCTSQCGVCTLRYVLLSGRGGCGGLGGGSTYTCVAWYDPVIIVPEFKLGMRRLWTPWQLEWSSAAFSCFRESKKMLSGWQSSLNYSWRLKERSCKSLHFYFSAPRLFCSLVDTQLMGRVGPGRVVTVWWEWWHLDCCWSHRQVKHLDFRLLLCLDPCLLFEGWCQIAT